MLLEAKMKVRPLMTVSMFGCDGSAAGDCRTVIVKWKVSSSSLSSRSRKQGGAPGVEFGSCRTISPPPLSPVAVRHHTRIKSTGLSSPPSRQADIREAGNAFGWTWTADLRLAEVMATFVIVTEALISSAQGEEKSKAF